MSDDLDPREALTRMIYDAFDTKFIDEYIGPLDARDFTATLDGSFSFLDIAEIMQNAQAAEITRLRVERATARREGMKDAAKWHDVRAMELSGKAGVARNFRQLLRQSDFHMESAAAIRAAAGEGK